MTENRFLTMTKPLFTIDEATRAKNTGALWLILGIPIGCGIGVALHNLALGVGIGFFLGATIAMFSLKKEGRAISPVTKTVMVVGLIAVLAFAIVSVIEK